MLVSEISRVFKGAVTAVTAEVVGYRPLRVQKGNAWWTDEIKMAIIGKRRANKTNTVKECGRRGKRGDKNEYN